MEFKRNARIQAPLSDVWALVDDVPTVAGCIPGVHDLDMRGEREFDCVTRPALSALLASTDRNTPQAASRIARFSPDLAPTRCPWTWTVPADERVMLAMRRSSQTIKS